MSKDNNRDIRENISSSRLEQEWKWIKIIYRKYGRFALIALW